jgi:hypothetical protein
MTSTPVRNIEEIAHAINAFAVEPNGTLLMTGPQTAIPGLALQHRLPTMFWNREAPWPPTGTAAAADVTTGYRRQLEKCRGAGRSLAMDMG